MKPATASRIALRLSLGHLGRIRMAYGSRHGLDHGIALRRPHRLSREQHRISKTVSRIGAFAPVLGIVLLVFELWACARVDPVFLKSRSLIPDF
jgi:hypothetical protein